MDTAFSIFHDIILRNFDKYVPNTKIKLKTISKEDRGWLTKGIKTSCKRKRELFILTKRCPDVNLSKYYKSYCVLLKQVITIARRNHTDRKISASKNKLRDTWKVINETVKGCKSQDLPSFIGLCDGMKTANSVTDAVDLFKNYFKSTASLNSNYSSGSKPVLPPFGTTSFFTLPVDEDELRKTIKGLKDKKSYGYDEISTSTIKYIADAILEPLLYLINLSLTDGKFPTRLKMANVKPIHKKCSLINLFKKI